MRSSGQFTNGGCAAGKSPALIAVGAAELIEQSRRIVIKHVALEHRLKTPHKYGSDLARPQQVDLCFKNLGHTQRRRLSSSRLSVARCLDRCSEGKFLLHRLTERSGIGCCHVVAVSVDKSSANHYWAMNSITEILREV